LICPTSGQAFYLGTFGGSAELFISQLSQHRWSAVILENGTGE
jgi:hypothetical protein